MVKKIVFVSIVVFIFLNACKNKDNTTTEQPEIASAKQKSETVISSGFDIEKIPVSNKEIGDFPYLSAPEGYEYKYEKNKNYEDKYFFYNDSLVTKIGGNYFFSPIWKKDDSKNEYEKSFVLKSYEDALEKLGAVKIYEGYLPTTAKDLIEKGELAYFNDLNKNYSAYYKQFVLKTSNGNIWFELFIVDNENEIRLSVLLQEGFKQTITLIKADEIKNQLDKTGKAILYINFDTDKSTLKSDGETAVDEIRKLLENDKTLKLSIEGHTDNTGDANHNKILSNDRANTVLKKLVSMKIDNERLKAIGYGADKPLLANNTKENKAKNRRVELVKM